MFLGKVCMPVKVHFHSIPDPSFNDPLGWHTSHSHKATEPCVEGRAMTDTEQETLDKAAISVTEEAAAEAPPEPEEATTSDIEVSTPITEPVQPGPMNPAPDGSKIAYFLFDSPEAPSLWVMSLDGGGARQLSTSFALVIDPNGPQWSPDGTQLAVTGLEGQSTAIWIIDVESGAATRPLVRSAADHSPRWSPDGSLIAFISRRNGRDAIHVAAPDGSMPAIQLTEAPHGHDEKEPLWSKDGSQLAFCRWSPEVGELQGGDQIWLVELATGESKQLTKNSREGAVWSGDRSGR